MIPLRTENLFEGVEALDVEGWNSVGDAFGPGSHPSDGTSFRVSAADAVSIPIAGDDA